MYLLRQHEKTLLHLQVSTSELPWGAKVGPADVRISTAEHATRPLQLTPSFTRPPTTNTKHLSQFPAHPRQTRSTRRISKATKAAGHPDELLRACSPPVLPSGPPVGLSHAQDHDSRAVTSASCTNKRRVAYALKQTATHTFMHSIGSAGRETRFDAIPRIRSAGGIPCFVRAWPPPPYPARNLTSTTRMAGNNGSRWARG